MNRYEYTMTQAVLALMETVGNSPQFNGPLSNELRELGVDLNELRAHVRTKAGDAFLAAAHRDGHWDVADTPDPEDPMIVHLEATIRSLCISFAMLTCAECLKYGRPSRERVPGVLTHQGPEVETPSPLGDCVASWIWSRTPPEIIKLARQAARRVREGVPTVGQWKASVESHEKSRTPRPE